MGSTPAGKQAEKLGRFKQMMLMLDGDLPGREAAQRVAEDLAGIVSVTVVSVPESPQPDQTTPAEIRALLMVPGASRRRGLPEACGRLNDPGSGLPRIDKPDTQAGEVFRVATSDR